MDEKIGGTGYSEIQIEIESRLSIETNSNRSNNHEIKSEKSYEIIQVEPKPEPIDFSKNYYQMTCPYCSDLVTTKLEQKPGKLVWISAIGLLFLPPLCFIPFCIKKCFDKHHYCTNCSKKIGMHKTFC